MSRLLWIVQVALTLVFLFSGSFKLIAPIEMLTASLPLPSAFIRFLGAAETLGALGLCLPGLLRVQTRLVPLAAAGLVIIMAGATLLTPALTGGQIAPALLPLALGVLAAFVAYGRSRLAPLPQAPRRPSRISRDLARPMVESSDPA